MTGVNHALTGGAIGLAVENPIAIPLAFISHFILDALPHFGVPAWKNRPPIWWLYLAIDGVLTALAIFWLSTSPTSPVLIVFCALAAIAPDFSFVVQAIGRLIRPQFQLTNHDPIFIFHSNIQTSETPHGLLLELLWLVTMTWLVADLL